MRAAVCLVALVEARDRRIGHERDGLDLDLPPRSSVTRITARDELGGLDAVSAALSGSSWDSPDCVES